MKENGLTTRPLEKEFTYIRMELHTQDNGSMINNMGMEFKSGLMEHNIKGTFNRD